MILIIILHRGQAELRATCDTTHTYSIASWQTENETKAT